MHLNGAKSYSYPGEIQNPSEEDAVVSKGYWGHRSEYPSRVIEYGPSLAGSVVYQMIDIADSFFKYFSP